MHFVAFLGTLGVLLPWLGFAGNVLQFDAAVVNAAAPVIAHATAKKCQCHGKKHQSGHTR